MGTAVLLAEIDWDKVLAPLFGGLLVVIGLIAMWLHVRGWRRQREETFEDDADRAHFRSRYRRRMQVSGLMCLIGVMIAAGDALVPWQRLPALFAVYWLVVLLVAVWMLMLALADMYASRTHMRASLARIRVKQRILERQLAETARGERFDDDDFE